MGYSVSAFELFKAVYENKVTAVRLTEMSAPQLKKFLKWIRPSHVTQPNLQKQYLSFTKSLKLTIGSTIQFQLQPTQTSSALSDFHEFAKLFLSLSDITVVIKLGKWNQIQEWKASLQKLWQSFTLIKKIKIEIKGEEEMINSSLALSVRSLLFGGLACLTEIFHLSFFQIRFTSIGTNDYIAIQQSLRTIFQKNKITSLHLERCTEFPIFHGELELSAIDVSLNINLTQLRLQYNKFSAIDVSNSINLIHLGLSSNQLFAIDVSNNVNLTHLDLSSNRFSAIDVSNNINLTHLDLRWNRFSAIDVSNNTNLTHLDLRWNIFSAIDVSNNVNLTQLRLRQNELSAIDVSKNINLTHLDLSSNRFFVIDLSKNINLAYLDLSQYNQLSAIDVSNNINLTHLILSSNKLSAINVSKNINLKKLNLRNNQLSTIDLSNNINLTQLWLNSNKISAIDLSNNINLTELKLYSNKLSEIDAINCTKLTKLYLQVNSLKSVLLSFPSLLQYTDFRNQRSAVCEVQLLYNNHEDFQQCNERAKEWTEKYRKGGDYNRHGCNYAFACSKRK